MTKKMIKVIRNKNGFSLIELLIVIALLGIIAAIGFLTLTGVLNSSRQKVDYRNADLIERAIEAYMFLTEDGELKHLTNSSNDKINDGDDSEKLILILQDKVINGKNGEELDPLLVPKEGKTPSADNFATQWEEHKGYKIEIYSDNMTCDVNPVKNAGDAIIKIN
jgi:type IV pilus assembly protein PilA